MFPLSDVPSYRIEHRDVSRVWVQNFPPGGNCTFFPRTDRLPWEEESFIFSFLLKYSVVPSILVPNTFSKIFSPDFC